MKGETALDLSMRKGKDDAVAGLLKYGAAVCSDHIITAIKSGDVRLFASSRSLYPSPLT